MRKSPMKFSGADYYESGATFNLTLDEGVAVKGSVNGSYTFGGAGDDLNADDIFYAVTLPANYEITSGTTYYRGTVTAKPKTGFTGDTITQDITEVTTLTGAATFDAVNHYVYQDGTNYILATAENASGHDLTQVYKLTLPEHVTANGALLIDGNNAYCATNTTITIDTAAGYIFKADDQTTDYNLTADIDLSGVEVLRGARNDSGILWSVEGNILTIAQNYTGENLLSAEEINALTTITAQTPAAFVGALNNLAAGKDKLTCTGDGYTLTSDESGNVTLNLTSTATTAWSAAASLIKTVNLDSTVSTIPADTFKDCTKLTAVNITAAGEKSLVVIGRVVGTGEKNILEMLSGATTISALEKTDKGFVLVSGLSELCAGEYAVSEDVSFSELTVGGAVTVNLPSEKTLSVSSITNEENLRVKFGDGEASDKSAEVGEEWRQDSEGKFNYTAAGFKAGWYLKEGKVSYRGDERKGFSLEGMSGTATLEQVKAAVEISGCTVTIADESILGDRVTISGEDGYELGLGTLSESVFQEAKLEGDSYTATGFQAGRYLDEGALTARADNIKRYSISGLSAAAKLEDNVIISDGETTVFKLKAGALNKESVAISGGAFSVELDGDVDTTGEAINVSKTLSGGTLSYTASGTGESYKATATGVSYTGQQGGEQFTLSGISNAEGVEINGYNVRVKESAPDMTASAAYKVKLEGDSKFVMSFGGNMDSTTKPAALEGGIYTAAYTPAYFTGSGAEFTFTPAEIPDTCTISGLGDGAKLDDNVIISDGSIKISAGAFTNSHDKISVSDSNYTLEVTDSQVKQIKFAHSGNTITLGGSCAGYAKVGDAYEWQEQQGGEQLTISGLKSGVTSAADMFTRDGDKIIFKPTDELLPDEPYIESE